MLFLDFSKRALTAECSGEDVLLDGERERFFLELSSKNSMTKALCGWDSGEVDEGGCSESGEAERCGGDALANCDET